MRTLLLAVTLALPAVVAAQQQPNDRNVILVVTDGLRWQEVFKGGTDGVSREAMMPFLWGTIAKQGQVFGNREIGSSVVVTNGLKFSYPGYNEMLAGFADARIDKNDFGVNPNVTVFEWLNGIPALRGKVAAFATWETFGDIFARKRAGIATHFGWERPYPTPRSASDSQLNTAYDTTTRTWSTNAFDPLMHAVAIRYLTQHRPRVVFLGYGETDEWAHAKRYDRMVEAARRVDGYLAEVWSLIQRLPEYRDKTTLIVTTDHGRGRTAADWTNHGRDVDGAEEMWIAVIGPDTPALGERSGAPTVTQAQIAATIAALLGLDYVVAQPKAARPIADVLKR